MSATHTNVLVRVPNALLERLNRAAIAMGRTRTAAVCARLEASMANETVDAHGVIVVYVPRSFK